MSDIANLRTETGKIYEEARDAKSGAPRYTQEVVTGPIHYKEAYRDADPWLDLDASYSETSEIKGVGKVLVYPKMPNIVTVYQDRCGYKIQSRSNPEHIATVELVSIDGQEVTAWQKTDALNVYARVHPYRVGIWKDFSGAAKAKATTMRWKVTEKGNGEKDSHPFAFRENPEAFSTADLTDLSPEGLDAAKVAIETARTRIDDNSWYWDETIPSTAKLVDTDWQVNANANDAVIYNKTGVFQYSYHEAFGYTSGEGYVDSYWRFTSIGITQGSTINSCYLQHCSANNTGTGVYARYYGNDVDNATAPTTYSGFTGLTKTSAYVDYTVPSMTQNNWYNSPSLVSILQEIVDRSGFSSGNAVAMMGYTTTSTALGKFCEYYDYDESTSKATKLTATWTVPSGHPASKRMAGVPFAAMRRGVW